MAHSDSDATRTGYPVRDSGDAWVESPDGSARFWGRFGAAGLLAYDPAKGVLLQLRVGWSHFGGTWGIPGGALHEGEDAVSGALREAHEEAGVTADSIEVLFTRVRDLGYWSYTTVVGRVIRPFAPVISDAESVDLAWVALDAVALLPLHPGLAEDWPTLRDAL